MFGFFKSCLSVMWLFVFCGLSSRLWFVSVVFFGHSHFHVFLRVRGSFFMFVESGCISKNIEFTVP